jgi:hypothetical protein
MSEHLGGRAEERVLLTGFLDWNRGSVVNKVRGLSRADATRVMTPSGLSALGVVAHLAAVEVGWFAETFAGEPVDLRWDARWSFRVEAGDTVESVVAEYEEACERSRAIVAVAPTLDVLSAVEHIHWGHVTLRWVLVHMLEETARHAGHLDLMRESIDGVTGY